MTPKRTEGLVTRVQLDLSLSQLWKSTLYTYWVGQVHSGFYGKTQMHFSANPVHTGPSPVPKALCWPLGIKTKAGRVPIFKVLGKQPFYKVVHLCNTSQFLSHLNLSEMYSQERGVQTTITQQPLTGKRTQKKGEQVFSSKDTLIQETQLFSPLND